MRIITESSKTWREWDGKSLVGGQIVAVVGTAKELSFSDEDDTIYWSVSLPGGNQHPLWGKNFCKAETIKEAELAAEEFLDNAEHEALAATRKLHSEMNKWRHK